MPKLVLLKTIKFEFIVVLPCIIEFPDTLIFDNTVKFPYNNEEEIFNADEIIEALKKI